MEVLPLLRIWNSRVGFGHVDAVCLQILHRCSDGRRVLGADIHRGNAGYAPSADLAVFLSRAVTRGGFDRRMVQTPSGGRRDTELALLPTQRYLLARGSAGKRDRSRRSRL